ncbi:unnamed protein product, partial [Polarella glacialis]
VEDCQDGADPTDRAAESCAAAESDPPGQEQGLEVEVQCVTATGPGASILIQVPPERFLSLEEGPSIGLLRELVTARCGGGGVGSHIRLVRRLNNVLFLPLRDEELLGDRRHLLLLGVDLAGVDLGDEGAEEHQTGGDSDGEDTASEGGVTSETPRPPTGDASDKSSVSPPAAA